MKVDSNAQLKGKRITGTLHTRRDAHPAASGDESLPREKAAAGEVAGRPKNSGQNDDKEVGWERKSTSLFSKLHASMHARAQGFETVAAALGHNEGG
jgi:hypothetical protein